MTVAKRLAAVSAAGGSLALASVALAQPATQHSALTALRVSSSPEGKGVLSRQHQNTVVATSKLSFIVTLHNNDGRRRLTFIITVSGSKSSLGRVVRTKTVWLRANQPATVKLGPFSPIAFAVPEHVHVAIRDTHYREQWTAVYPVIFSLG